MTHGEWAKSMIQNEPYCWWDVNVDFLFWLLPLFSCYKLCGKHTRLTHTHPYAYKMMKYHQHFLIHSHLYHSQFHHQWIHNITWKSHSGEHYDRNREGESMNGNNSLLLILSWDKSRIFVCESKNGLKATVRNDCQCKY